MTDSSPAESKPLPPARILRLEDPSEDHLEAYTTVQERVAMVALLSRRMWEISGRTWPSYSRENLPIHISRPE